MSVSTNLDGSNPPLIFSGGKNIAAFSAKSAMGQKRCLVVNQSLPIYPDKKTDFRTRAGFALGPFASIWPRVDHFRSPPESRHEDRRSFVYAGHKCPCSF